VDRDLDTGSATELDGGEQMLVQRMHPTGADESHHMQRAVAADVYPRQLQQRWNAEELARLDGL